MSVVLNCDIIKSRGVTCLFLLRCDMIKKLLVHVCTFFIILLLKIRLVYVFKHFSKLL